MKRLIILSFAGVFLMTLSGLDLAWGKGHVPINKTQVCNKNGVVKNIPLRRLADEIEKGGCRLPACDFDNIFGVGTACSNVDVVENAGDGDAYCDTPGSPPNIPSNPAFTPACVNPY